MWCMGGGETKSLNVFFQVESGVLVATGKCIFMSLYYMVRAYLILLDCEIN